ncbi:MAG: Crp/Fnr family transcriptional regulator [Bacteroidetes bacterium]|nr:Crp/Fnr family transcriptional regulator [Bacteroidota bacterium]
MVAEIGNSGNVCHDCKDISCAAAILNYKELDQVRNNSRESTLKKGEVILHEGSLTSHIIYLKSGLVKEYVKIGGESEQILQIVKDHSYLGLPSLFGDRINHYSYAALEDCRICYIDINVFNSLIRKNGSFGYEILVSTSRDNLNNFNRFLNRSQKKIYGRVADAILYFAKIIYESQKFDLPFSRQEFADLIGVSRESATRVLIKFKAEGIIGLKGRTISIEKMELLEQISQRG